MKHFSYIDRGIDVSGVQRELDAQPELWNARGQRTVETSPHYGIPDIWVRYRRLDELKDTRAFLEPHYGVFYPEWDRLPSIQPIVFDIMRRVKATHLGAILITKIPAGCEVKPHDDRGSWHAEFHTTKVYVGIRANTKCVNYCGGDSLVINEGDVVTFNNLITHSVKNDGATDRITLIVCTATQ